MARTKWNICNARIAIQHVCELTHTVTFEKINDEWGGNENFIMHGRNVRGQMTTTTRSGGSNGSGQNTEIWILRIREIANTPIYIQTHAWNKSHTATHTRTHTQEHYSTHTQIVWSKSQRSTHQRHPYTNKTHVSTWQRCPQKCYVNCQPNTFT